LAEDPRLVDKVRRAILEEKIKRAAREQIEKDKPVPELSIKSAYDTPVEKLRTFFSGRLIQGSFQLMVGPGEAGKGFGSCDIIARFSTGEPFPGESSNGRRAINIMVCVTEDSAGRVRARLDAAGADLKRVFFAEGPPSLRGGLVVPSPVAFDDDAGALLQRCRDRDVGALFLETMVEHLGDRSRRTHWSTNNEAEVRRALSPVVAVCKEGGLIGWGVMHPRKSMDGGIEDSISGSAAFRNVGRSVLHVYRDPTDDTKSPWRLLITSKSNYMKSRPPTLKFRIESWEKDPDEGRVVWGIEGRTLIDDRGAEEIWRQMQGLTKKRKDYTVRDAENLLKRLLEDGMKSVEEIKEAAEQDSLSWSSVVGAKSNLRVESVKDGFPAKVIGWRLPPPVEETEL